MTRFYKVAEITNNGIGIMSHVKAPKIKVNTDQGRKKNQKTKNVIDSQNKSQSHQVQASGIYRNQKKIFNGILIGDQTSKVRGQIFQMMLTVG